MPPSDLPIDMSDPRIRDYIALIRLQVLTPLSFLVNIVAVIVCGLVIKPTIGDLSKIHPNPLTPQSSMIGTFVVILYVTQIGYCLLLVLARKVETKNTLVKGVGISFVIANWLMAMWAVAWSFQLWLVSTILLGLMIISLSYANIVLLIYHTPTTRRPLDIILIHLPARLITLGWSWPYGDPTRYGDYQLEGLAVVLPVNILALVAVILRHDVVWCFGAAWINAAIWSARPKAAPVFITTVVFTVVLPLALVAATVFSHLRNRKRGVIALPPDEEVHPRV
ncbi:hypothetical protein SISSUDRAFT_978388 [Sistotremastrum suecicum HHB10207 ss-3]|uniref:Uncharacterized protein n=1 Tax=Sistotremastrum suecicum HHB10207 ss-3 TaxID=1314776 RepID=A0A166I4M3_9AGAM|nr:hypothetical protein SISSUDRAFT_978388 [Sistotremastrum suecicum HHB10207 ss-3]